MPANPANRPGLPVAAGAAPLLLAVLLMLAVTASIAPGSSTAAVVEQTLTDSPAEVKSSWTRADRLAAKPLDQPDPAKSAFDLPRFPGATTSAATGDFTPADASRLPERLHGKVFFRVGANRYSCSGTLVSSATGQTIFTAGHCVYDYEIRQFVTDFIFVPGYDSGNAPFGEYPATALATTQGWANRGDLSYDIGIASLAGTPTKDLGGSEKVAFNRSTKNRSYKIYGYPADPQPLYDGEKLIGCKSEAAGRDVGSPRPIVAYPCNMSHGASGGSWMSGGYLSAVFSYIHCDSSAATCGYAFASYFSNAAKSLYTSDTAGGSVKPTVKVRYRPPAVVKKRSVLFKFAGTGSTPLTYRCKFDRRKYVDCGNRVKISRLTNGRHRLKVRSIDQTGRLSSRVITRKFRVSVKS
ncbi:MAG: hypothetical protein WBW62_12290 [Solirubrobacterales bacterium]